LKTYIYAATIVFLFTIAVHTGFADGTGAITGTVVDAKTGEVLIGANIHISGSNRGAATDENGEFKIVGLAPSSYTLVGSFLGYERQNAQVSVSANETVSVALSLAPKLLDVPLIEIIGQRIEQIQRIPGSALVIPERRLNMINPASANEVFRNVPGMNVRDEEGQGLRPNIGVRGLDPTRSRKVLMLEDGVPIALAPYGEPELYYNPPIDRMQRIEVLKGSGSILFGPQTVGGVINYITRQPPRTPTFSARILGGSNDYLSGLFSYGGTWGDVGVDGMYLHKQGAGFREYSSFGIHDLTTQFAFGLTKSSRLGIKLNVYDETSRSSYLGLTQAMFDEDPYQNPAIHDKMDVQRYSASATHQQILGRDLLLTTTVYANNAVRNWRRQDYDRQNMGREYERIAGDTTVPGGALYMRNSSGNRNREFTVYGVEPRLQLTHSALGLPGELDLGVRMHFEDMHILRINGTTPTAFSGTITEDEIRTTQALSGFIQNRFLINGALNVTTGVRIEEFSFTRTMRRGVVNGQLTDVHIEGTTRSTEIIPGAGITYKPFDSLTIFTGMHRGFSPPRVQDAIDTGGENLQLDAERSWNYELGLRANPLRWLQTEITAYYLDFQNQIIPASEAGGIDTRLINAGETHHRGVELYAAVDVGVLTSSYLNVVVEGSMTLSDAVFTSGIYDGNRLPHAPTEMYTIGITYHMPIGVDVQMTGFFTGPQYTDRANTREGSADGEIGRIDAYTVWDLSLNYNIPRYNGRVFANVKNMFDTLYIASRAPRGIFPGPFRQVNVGMQWDI
jgi:Fe(3+) dicitrate transport protein